MVLIGSTQDAGLDALGAETEALMNEARRRQRRRWARRLLVGAVVVGAAAAVAVWRTWGAGSPSGGGAATAGAFPNGPLAVLHTAGPLAVAPGGALYVTDGVGEGVEPGGDRVLVRLPDGRFRVVAGNGRVGFSGDGGPAVRAELSSVTDLAFAANGTLYIADGGRVRVVGRDGVIRTIVGNGQPLRGLTRIANGTRALSAALGSGRPTLQIALSPSGHLYISSGWQLLRLTAAGRLDTVRAVIAAGRDRGLPVGGPIAVDGHGNIDVGGSLAGWGVWQVAPNGIAHLASRGMYSGGNGGASPILEPGPGGAIYCACPGVFRVESDKLVSIPAVNGLLSRPLHGRAFTPFYIAFGPNGTLYTDDHTGGYTLKPRYASLARQQLLSIRNGRINLLWHGINRAEIEPAR